MTRRTRDVPGGVSAQRPVAWPLVIVTEEPPPPGEPGAAPRRQIGMRSSPVLRRAATGSRVPIAAGLAAAALLAVAACGSSGSGASSGATAPPAKVSLSVVVTPSPGAKPEHWTLRCEPTGGSHPDAAAACGQLLKAKNPFGPIPRGFMCPMIAAGPGQASVTGTYFGKHVTGTFSQSSGCSAMRWAQLGEMFAPVR